MTKPTTRRAGLAALAAAAATGLALPALSGGHATVSTLQPQGPALTAARTTYAVRAPNERDAQNTWKLVMYVPGPVQKAISIAQTPDWKIRMDRVATGEVGPEGGKVFAIRRVSWTAKTKDAEIEPGMFAQFMVRFQNPADAARLCFPMGQYYRNRDGTRRKPEIVNWTGPASSETPVSCVDVKAG